MWLLAILIKQTIPPDNSTYICISNIKWTTFFTIIFFPKKQTQPKLPLFAALSELIVFVLKSIFQRKKATFAQ